MIHVVVLADNFHHFQIPIQEYIKRTQSFLRFHAITPSKLKNPPEIAEDEAKKIDKFFKNTAMPRGQKIYLNIDAITYSSEELAARQEKLFQYSTHIYYIIGGAYGLPKEFVNSFFDEQWSLSRLTFPHSLAILMTLEQLYRAHEIQKGSKYHHGDI
ncbi:MAG: 23S rRNA (pseudouridine(1915)-N(3))-methyltransferase RlmH [Candidatus Gracilibacteria bacterium]